ncbi:ABC transporter ATP-binding protein [Persicimonas caeni]|uniref:ABC transporter ATP-binding protein n=1 Tax=Persicimonas caeni TaxID=2292766 RepID=A0A4Y6Q1R9_PERCE|nr:ABC transporter ATP-binding protein [Persicimonas caeni]QDG54551.1 ABC transporter ATP-binding protein [Persicimonas caeni]QED35772.1 ABC transporter ATP-binding protein [Persicimonas caeni]
MTETAAKNEKSTAKSTLDERPKILEVKNLKTHFKTDEGVVRAVDGVSFAVRKGESLGIVGESGSGKSVTQISILGLIPSPPGEIVDGQILFQGEDLLEKKDKELRKIRGNKISMIWQDPMTSLNPFLRISKQLIEPLRLHKGMDKAAAKQKAIEMLDKVGIPGAAERIDQYPHQFSGGMRQRVMIAMALLCEPELLIADEPTTALDVTIQAQILELIKSLRKDFGTSVVTITHDLGVVAGMADRIIVMYAGRMMEEAPARELFHHPAHPYTVGLLKSVPRLDRGRTDELIPIEGRPPDTSKDIPGCPFVDRCPWAIDKCHKEFPEPKTFGDGHRSFCWRADEVYAAKLGSKSSSERVHEIEQKVRAGETIDTTAADAAGGDDV